MRRTATSIFRGYENLLQGIRARLTERLDENSLGYRVLQKGFRIIRAPVNLFRRNRTNSVFFREEDLPMCSLFPKEILDLAISEFSPKTVLDVGCGTGVSIDYFLSRDIQATGIEGSALAIEHAKNPEQIHQRDLEEPIDIGKRFDMVWCFEVAEHIHPRFVESLMSTLTSHADVVVFSGAQPGQGGEGHFNEQPPSYWIEKFADRGFRHLPEQTDRFHALEAKFSENMLIFESESPNQPPSRSASVSDDA
jgi:SAM-dependent methyltransferase